jgi:CheY-like chemotaxis protein
MEKTDDEILDDEILSEQEENSNIRKIAILDDKESEAILIKEILKEGSRYDLRFKIYTDPLIAKRNISARNGYDCIISDINLNSIMDGREFIQSLRESENPIECPAILYSSFVDDNVPSGVLKDIPDCVYRQKFNFGDEMEKYKFCLDVDMMISEYSKGSHISDIKFAIREIMKHSNESREMIHALGTITQNIQSSMLTRVDLVPITQQMSIDISTHLRSESNNGTPIPTIDKQDGEKEITLNNLGDIVESSFKNNYKVKIFVLTIRWMGKMILSLVGIILLLVFGSSLIPYLKNLKVVTG